MHEDSQGGDQGVSLSLKDLQARLMFALKTDVSIRPSLHRVAVQGT